MPANLLGAHFRRGKLEGKNIFSLFSMETRTLLIVQNKIQRKNNYQSGVGERTFPLFRSHKMQFYPTIQHCYASHFCKTMFEYFCRGKAAVKWWAWVLLQYFDVALFNFIYRNLCLISWQQLESLLCLWVICKCLKQRCFFCIFGSMLNSFVVVLLPLCPHSLQCQLCHAFISGDDLLRVLIFLVQASGIFIFR